MKIAAASLTEEQLFARVAAAIREISGYGPEKILPEARLREDLGIHGDDGHDLLAMLHEQFEMDWTGLDLRVHFGSEGLGAPLLPWRVQESADHFEPRPVTVAGLMAALREGRWPEGPVVPASARQRRMLHAASWAQLGVLGLVVLLAAAVMIGRAVGS